MVYVLRVQHHIDPAVLKAARKDILIFHICEQIRFRHACTFQTKTPGLVLIQTVWYFNVVIVERLF